jgi:hypothetical protein
MIVSRRSAWPGAIAALSAAVLLAMASGLVAALGSNLLIVATFAPLGFLCLLLLRPEHVVLALFAFSAVIAGTVGYFARVGQAQWLPTAFAIALYFVVALHVLKRSGRMPRLHLSPILIAGLVYLLVAAFSTALATESAIQWLYGFRFHFAMVAVLLAVALTTMETTLIRRLWAAVLVVAVVQLPVVLYQYVFVAGRRVREGVAGAAWDSIVGTFGGNPDGGGQSPALGFFVTAALVFALVAWRRQVLPGWKALIVVGVGVAAILLAEIKFFLLLVPLGVVLAFRSQLLARPRALVAGTLCILVIVLGLPHTYGKLHYERSGRSPPTIAEFYAAEWELRATLDSGWRRSSGQMQHLTQVAYWWRQHDLSQDPRTFLVGHGLGALNVSRLHVGTVARQYAPFSVSNTGSAYLLWEIGLLGALAYVLLLAAAAAAAWRLAARPSLPAVDRAILDGAGVVLVLAIATIPYKDVMFKSPAISFLVYFAIGTVIYWQLRVRAASQGRASVTAPGAPRVSPRMAEVASR